MVSIIEHDSRTTGDDGDVDGMDYLAWLFQTGSSNGDYSADADDDGDVDSDDLGYWIANSGNLLSLINVG